MLNNLSIIIGRFHDANTNKGLPALCLFLEDSSPVSLRSNGYTSWPTVNKFNFMNIEGCLTGIENWLEDNYPVRVVVFDCTQPVDPWLEVESLQQKAARLLIGLEALAKDYKTPFVILLGAANNADCNRLATCFERVGDAANRKGHEVSFVGLNPARLAS